MKQFIKDWILPPKLLNKCINVKHYLSSYDHKLLFSDKLRNTENGKRCFIIGTGSSIASQNLGLLKNEIVIGVSGLFNHKDIDIINPKYYVNPPIFMSHGKYYEEKNFISYLQKMDTILSDETIMFFHVGDQEYIDKYQLFKHKKIIWKDYRYWEGGPITKIELNKLPAIWSVSESAIQIALYLGFDKIYLLGFDHDWFNGLFNYAFDTNNARQHFSKSAEEIIKEHGVDSEFQMKRHTKIFGKYKKLYALKQNIYNANSNPNSYVDTFPKVNFESLFEK